MGYQLGIDLGTTYTAAAVCRGGRAEVATLGSRAASVPSVLYLREDGGVVVGEAAERRAAAEGDRVVREFKRRIGDATPLIVAGAPFSAEALSARLLRWVVDAVSEREGGRPERILVTHPASWGPYKKDLFSHAARLADLGPGVAMLTEPEAAAVSYAAAERVEAGSTVAVYDLGGGTFDAAVLRRSGGSGGGAGGFEFLGVPEGIERLGGIDFDETVFAHVGRALGGVLEGLDPADPVAVSAVARLRRDCVEAKEALSADTEVSIPVMLPERRTQVRLVRAEFEAMIRPAVDETVGALLRALRSAGLEPGGLEAVLLVGGSSRIPLVGQMISESLGRPVAVDADPKHAIALGAALAAGGALHTPAAQAAPTPNGAHAGSRTGARGEARTSAPGVGAAGIAAGAGVSAVAARAAQRSPMPAAAQPSAARPSAAAAPPPRESAAPPRAPSREAAAPPPAPPRAPSRPPVGGGAPAPAARMPEQGSAPRPAAPAMSSAFTSQGSEAPQGSGRRVAVLAGAAVAAVALLSLLVLGVLNSDSAEPGAPAEDQAASSAPVNDASTVTPAAPAAPAQRAAPSQASSDDSEEDADEALDEEAASEEEPSEETSEEAPEETSDVGSEESAEGAPAFTGNDSGQGGEARFRDEGGSGFAGQES